MYFLHGKNILAVYIFLSKNILFDTKMYILSILYFGKGKSAIEVLADKVRLSCFVLTYSGSNKEDISQLLT